MLRFISILLFVCQQVSFGQIIIMSAPYMAAAEEGYETYTDDFEGRSEAALAGQGLWVQETGSMGVEQPASDKMIYANSSNAEISIFYNGTFGANHYSQAVVDEVAEDNIYIGVTVENQNDGGDYYIYYADDNNSILARIDGGVFTALDGAGTAWELADVVRIERSGDSIICKINGVRDNNIGTYGAVKDITYTGGKPGVGGYSTSYTGNLDDWQGGTIE